MSNENFLIYTFWIPRGIIAKTLFEFDSNQSSFGRSEDNYKIIYISGDRGLKTLESQIIKFQPTHIVGLGYYRRGTKHIRNEKFFKNLYGKMKINEEGKDSYFTNWSIKHEFVKDANNAGTSRCNQYGYKTLEILQSQNITNTKFAYLHVPPDFNKEIFQHIILSIIKSAQLQSSK